MRAIDVVRRVAPKARAEYLAAFEHGDALLQAHGITTPLRLAHFLAQVLHESGGLQIEWESGNYSAKRLLEVFGVGHHSARVTAREAAGLAYHPEEIFERVYGLGNPKKARELGNTQPGDGFRYRGGGILQTTGRANYRRMGEACGVDFEAQPELVLSAEHALKPALAEWSEGDLNRYADKDDITTITRRINGGLNGLADRRQWLRRLKPIITAVDFAGDPQPIEHEDAPAMDDSDIPVWLATMRAIDGTHETPGGADNPAIMGWRDTIDRAFPELAGYTRTYTHDSIPWCGLTVAYVMAANGIRPPSTFLWARSWAKWGTKTRPRRGAVMVFSRGSGGHVALYEGETATQYIIRGGNQADAVNVTRIAKSRLLDARWPDEVPQLLGQDPPAVMTMPVPIAAPARPGFFRTVVSAIKGDAPATAADHAPVARPGLEPDGDPGLYDIQAQLAAKGYVMVGVADGEMGPNTRAAILAFRSENGLPVTAEVDDEFRAALAGAPYRQIATRRATATIGDMRRHGAAPVRTLDGFKWLGGLVAGAGALGGVQDSGVLDQVQNTLGTLNDTAASVGSIMSSIIGTVEWAISHWWLIAVVLGLYILYRVGLGFLEARAMWRQGTLVR